MKILHVASECLPLIKTGGLADVLGALPAAQRGLGEDARIALPAYRDLAARLTGAQPVGAVDALGFRAVVIEGRLGTTPVWLIDVPALYDRDGDPYRDAQGQDFADNALRFGLFGEVCAQLALGAVDGWRAEVLHGHDWQAGTALAWCEAHGGAARPLRVFTLHNLAYQGRYGRDAFDTLRLPQSWWQMERAEFHGDWSFLKLGLTSAQHITTVSPTYAREILTPEFGCGLDGLLRSRAIRLRGILNGIDPAVWNPATDPHLGRRYTPSDVAAGKRANQSNLCAELGIDRDQGLLVGLIGRMTEQKGFDLAVAAMPELIAEGMRFAVLGAGDRALEQAFAALAAAYPGRVGLRLRYDEALAHRIEAGVDAFLMPSRFEPCGLNQMYSQRYGTVPVVRSAGGLVDTVFDATPDQLGDGSATGVRFEHADVGGVLYGLRRAQALHADPKAWKALQRAGMRQDFSWDRAAREYLQLYRQAD